MVEHHRRALNVRSIGARGISQERRLGRNQGKRNNWLRPVRDGRHSWNQDLRWNHNSLVAGAGRGRYLDQGVTNDTTWYQY